MLPPQPVLDAFECTGTPQPLAGGQARSIRCGDVVLKPCDCDDSEETDWVCESLVSLDAAGFRVAMPLRTRDGCWEANGWTAAEFVMGRSDPEGRWSQLFTAGRRFHEALRELSRPAFLDRRQHQWAIADRVAWGEAEIEPLPDLSPVIERCISLLRPIEVDSQVVHGDLSGNVLFADGLEPAIIDFSPYWRPTAWAEAVVAVDGILWYGADHHLFDIAGAEHADFPQVLVRAVIFRVVALNERVRRIGGSYHADLASFESLASTCEQLCN